MMEIRLQGTGLSISCLADKFGILGDDCIGMLSVAVSTSYVRGFTDMLRGEGYAIGWIDGRKTSIDPCGYMISCSYSKDTSHITATSKRPGFMPECNSAWATWWLTRKHVTTPVLGHWVEDIRKTMVRKKLIKYLPAKDVYGCRPAMMEFTNEDLDAIVSKGVGSGKFKIQ